MRVVIADDHPLFREGVAAILSAEPDVEVVGQAAHVAEVIRLCSDHQPDMILLDIDMPGDPLRAIPVIRDINPISKIVMLTVSENEQHMVTALQAGARGYVLKGVGARELVRILRAVCEGEDYVTPWLAARIMMNIARQPPESRAEEQPLESLSEREQQVLGLVAAGYSNKEIGQALQLTEKTVKHYVTSILQKMHVRNRVEAALMASRKEAPPGSNY